MTIYFRLFLVSAILLIGLGLFSDQSEDAIFLNPDPDEIENVQLQLGLLPVLARFSSTHFLLFNSQKCLDALPDHSRFGENLRSKRIDNLFFILNSKFSNRKPEMIFKTGQSLHTKPVSKDPLLI